MAHDFESGFFGGNKEAWHGLGQVIPQEVVTTEEAIRYAGLDWDVIKVPVMFDRGGGIYGPDLAQYPGKFVTMRDVDGSPLGIVSDRYTTVQNSEAFAFGDDILDSGDAKWHTAGSLGGGKQVWMLAKMNEDLIPAGEESERIEQYMLVTSSHDGSMALTVAMTDVRVVCKNTQSLALATAKRKFAMKHTKKIEGRIQEARQALELAHLYGNQLKNTAEQMMNDPFSSNAFYGMMKELIPIPTEQGRSRTIAQNKQQTLHYVYKASDNIDNVRDTKWGALQAVIEYSDHHTTSKDSGENSSDENRFRRIVGGADIIDMAYNYLTYA